MVVGIGGVDVVERERDGRFDGGEIDVLDLVLA